jgi:hypothetical protein
MSAGGIAVALFGVLVICQVTIGQALERLGLINAIVQNA